MIIKNGVVYLSSAMGFDNHIDSDFVYMRDVNNNKVAIPKKVILEAYDALERSVENENFDFHKWRDALYANPD